ncbi:C39 family peptidase [bacterium]|nr:C39 family peptidase [bacterium]
MTLLDVEYIQQFLPGCPDDKNGCCGPASLTMCACYALGRNPRSSDILSILASLNHRLDGTGGGTRWTELLSAGKEVFGLDGLAKEMWGLDEIRSEIAVGRPMIVGLHSGFLTNRNYEFSGGHYVAAVGFDTDYILCLDPAARSSEPFYYSNADMQAAMTALGENVPNGVMHGFIRTSVNA